MTADKTVMEQSTQELWQAVLAVQFLKSRLKIMLASRRAPKAWTIPSLLPLIKEIHPRGCTNMKDAFCHLSLINFHEKGTAAFLYDEHLLVILNIQRN